MAVMETKEEAEKRKLIRWRRYRGFGVFLLVRSLLHYFRDELIESC